MTKQVAQSHDASHFDKRGNSVLIWKIKAQEFYEAAALVWNGKVIQCNLGDGLVDETHLLYRPTQLLMGLCLEVLLKGLLVEQNPQLIVGGNLPKQLKTHSLEDLFKDAGIKLESNNGEPDFIRKLSDAVEWIAKYPIPIKAGHLKNPKHGSSNPLLRSDYDFKRFEMLRQRVMDEYKITK